MFVLCCDVTSDVRVTRFNEKRKKSLFSARPRLSVFLSLDNFFFLVVEKVRGGRTDTSIEKKRTDQNKKELSPCWLQHVNEKAFVLNFCLSLWVLS